MFAGLATFMPNSPRQLLRIGRVDEARAAFLKIRRDYDLHESFEEYTVMKAQIEYEMRREVTSIREVFSLFKH